MADKTIFTRIIDGEIPGTFVWRDAAVVALMSINPIATGHVLVVPIAEVDHWLDAPPELAARAFEVARIIGLAQQEAFDVERIGVVIAGYEVPHMHVHVIPTRSMADVAFANAADHVARRDLDAAADAIRARLRAAGRPEVAE
jgi:histidine triad (HIT) family protein